MTMRYTNPRLLYFTLQVLFASAAYSAPEASVFASSVAAAVPSSVCLSCQIYFFHFVWSAWEVIATTNRLNDDILGEIGTETRKQDKRENLNPRQSVLLRCQTRADA